MIYFTAMAIYIAVPLIESSERLNHAVETFIHQNDRYKLQDERGWLIKFDGTTIDLCNQIKLTGQEPGEVSPVGSAIITPITAYYGRGPSDMWEWLKIRFEE